MLWKNFLIIYVVEYREPMSHTWIKVIFLAIVDENKIKRKGFER